MADIRSGSPGFETEEKINQCETDSNRWFPNADRGLAFLTLCLAGEVGELANLVKKVERGSALLVRDNKVHREIVDEINDVRVYLYNLMGLQIFDDVNWEDEWNRKRAFNEERFGPKARDVARASLPKQVLAEAGYPVGDVTQTWQTPEEFAS